MHSYLTAEKREEPIHEVLIRISHVVLKSLQRPFCCNFLALDFYSVQSETSVAVLNLTKKQARLI